MEWYMFFFLGLIAFLYSSVGHGGASGYLAFMGIVGMDTLFMKSTALTLNLFVSFISFLFYYRGGFFRLKLLWPFVITSIPFSFIGAQILIDPKIYKILLGVFLLFATLRMVIHPKQSQTKKDFSYPLALFTGAFLGLLSGMIGIGGGIILSPLIILLGWGNVKEAAAVSAPFIFFNSFSGLGGLLVKGFHFVPEISIWISTVILAGMLGSFIGSKILSTQSLRYVLAVVLGMAGFKLFIY
jgi:uncharacterized membrane protein YfcA